MTLYVLFIHEDGQQISLSLIVLVTSAHAQYAPPTPQERLYVTVTRELCDT